MAIKSGSIEYYDFFVHGKRSLGLTLQMVASNYQFRVTVSELDQEGEEVWGYTDFNGFLNGEDVPRVVKAWSIELDWCDDMTAAKATTLTSVFKEIVKNIGKKVLFHWDETNELFCVAIVDPNHIEDDKTDDYYEDDYSPTPEEIEEMMETSRQNQIARLIEAGLFDPETGDFSPEYYAESDFAYDCARERRYR